MLQLAWRTVSGAAALALWLAACSGDTTTKEPGSSGAGGTGGTSSVSSCATLPAVTPDDYVGQVEIAQYLPSGGTGANWYLAAMFGRKEPDRVGGTCQYAEYGCCRVADCTLYVDVDAMNEVGAGTIEVIGAAQPVTVEPEPDGQYPPVSGEGQLWEGGETLALAASGGEAPAFEANLRAPEAITVVEPVPHKAGDSVVLSRGKPLSIRWSGATQGTVRASVSQTIASGTTYHTVSVNCWYEAASGLGVVPAEAMAAVPAGPDGDFDLRAREEVTLVESGWSITLGAVGGTKTPVGDVPSFRANIQ